MNSIQAIPYNLELPRIVCRGLFELRHTRFPRPVQPVVLLPLLGPGENLALPAFLLFGLPLFDLFPHSVFGYALHLGDFGLALFDAVLKALDLVERALIRHRQFLDALKVELERLR